MLESGGRRCSFFQAVHLIQSCFPDAPHVGTQGPADRECLRFRADLSLAFPSSDITEIRALPRAGGDEVRFEVTTSFLGLYGPSSPLPAFYTEDLLDVEADESLVREFLDLFQHRLLSLFYRCWEKYCYPLQFRGGGRDRISRHLLAALGLSPDLEPQDDRSIPPVRILAYAGLLTQHPRSAASLRGILADYFEGMPVAIQQCVEQSLEIAPGERNRLGARNSELGVNFAIGERMVDRSATFRIRVGPVGLDMYLSLLPPGANRARLEQLVDFFNADALDFELEVWLSCDEIPALELSGETARLGWSTWLGERPPADQFVRFLCKGRSNGHR
jgi:type VI secretion system protein ImpH